MSSPATTPLDTKPVDAGKCDIEESPVRFPYAGPVVRQRTPISGDDARNVRDIEGTVRHGLRFDSIADSRATVGAESHRSPRAESGVTIAKEKPSELTEVATNQTVVSAGVSAQVSQVHVAAENIPVSRAMTQTQYLFEIKCKHCGCTDVDITKKVEPYPHFVASSVHSAGASNVTPRLVLTTPPRRTQPPGFTPPRLMAPREVFGSCHRTVTRQTPSTDARYSAFPQRHVDPIMQSHPMGVASILPGTRQHPRTTMQPVTPPTSAPERAQVAGYVQSGGVVPPLVRGSPVRLASSPPHHTR
eukprot:TRINITY_DN67712_c0_g1_i1.p1 TRINITY_DN67712_c0_g1~~TRINITY_DN67712_c0_g1_i1.p1  ORF type:complete len:302 (+),score=26.26 TRINITY_DN67712_c0_g1_i1:63-968(+)